MSKETNRPKMTRLQAEVLISEIDLILKELNIPAIVAGSYRRGKAEIGDLDFVVIDGNLDAIVSKLQPQEILAQGDVLVRCRYRNEQVEFTRTSIYTLGAALLHSTGSGAFNEGIRGFAKGKGLKLNQYGLWNGNERLAAATEEEIFAALKLEFIPPELRTIFGRAVPAGGIKANGRVAKILFEISAKYKQDGDSWRAKSFGAAGNTVKNWPEDLRKIKDPTELPGIGPSIATEIRSILTTGTSSRL